MCDTGNVLWLEFCVVERVRNTKNVLQCLWKCCVQQKHCWLLDKKNDCFWNGKSWCPLPCSGHPVMAVSPVTLHCADAIIVRISMSQLNNWHSLYQSAKELLVTPFEIFDNLRCVWDGFLGVSQSNTEPREKLMEKPYYLRYLQQMKPGQSFWARDKTAIHGVALSSVSMEEEN